MKGKKIRWWSPEIGREEKALVVGALDRNFPNEGKLTALFERKIAKLLGSRYAVAVTSGTAAMFLALKALNIKKGDEVIVPDLTFIATANAVEMCGARAVLVDIDPETMNISPSAFQRAISKKTRAVIPVHVSGRAAAIDDIIAIARKNDIYVIEDAAEAFMSRHRGKCLGTFGKAGCFSFSPHKTITTGQGGVAVTDDDNIYSRLRELKDQGRPVRGTGGDDKHNSIGYNFKFTDIQAALGLGQLMRLNARIGKAKEIHRRYTERLKGIEGISLIRFDIAGGEVPQWTDALTGSRDRLDAYLRKNGIECRRYWFPVHSQIPYKLPDRGFPNSTRFSPRALWLPSAFTMSDSDVDTVCGYIKKFFKQ